MIARSSESVPTPTELYELRKAMDSVVKQVNIRLREGEYQHSLAKAIAASELELHFPNVKELVEKLFGAERTMDQRFLNKIQTILKKMEKSGVIKILPKEKPWELQRYVLVSFRFEDVEKNIVTFATEDEMKKTKQLVLSQPKPEHVSTQRPIGIVLQMSLLIMIMTVSLVLVSWTLTQTPVNLTIFVTGFCVAVISSTILGILIGRKK